MIRIRGPDQVRRIDDPDIRQLVDLRFEQILGGETYDHDRHGEMIVAEPRDTVEMLEREVGSFILSDYFGELRFGDADFIPSFEALEEHANCYEMTFIFNDDGFGLGLYIPKQTGIDIELLAMCAQFAVPAHLEITST